MPFQSEKQRRYLWANEPEIARDWSDTYGSRIEKNSGGISQLVKSGPGRPGYGGPQDWGQEERRDKVTAGTATQREKDLHTGAISGIDNPYTAAAQQKNRDLNQQIALRNEVRKQQEEKREEKVERFRNRELGRFGNKKTRDFFLNKVWQSQKGMFEGIDMYNLSHKEQEELYDKYMAARMAGEIDAYGNPTGGGGGGDGSYYPRDMHPGTGVIEVDEVEEGPSLFQQSLTGTADTPDYYVGNNPLASNIAWGKKFGADPRTMGLTSYAADGGRIPRAFGGIMDSSTGRRAYGFGSIGKIFGKIGKAAGKVLKSDVGKAALMAAATYKLGGGNFFGGGDFKFGNILPNLLYKDPSKAFSMANLSPWKGIGALSMLPFLTPGPEEDEDEAFDYDAAKQLYADKIMNIKRGVSAGTLNPDQWSYLPSDYVYTGAKGGRAGFYAGGQSVPSDYTIEDAMMTTTQDKLGGITDVMKQADLNRQGSVGQFYAAQGGRIGYKEGGDDSLMGASMSIEERWERIKKLLKQMEDIRSGKTTDPKYDEPEDKAYGGRIGYAHGGAGYPPVTTGQISQLPNQMPGSQAQRPNPMPAPQPNRMAAMHPMMNPMGGAMPRVMAQEGGLMDLGGMEKDYRNDGGFVPLGGEEKADDVPARLSKNEFVFTADAVRGAGGGDIDKGAEIMENVMNNLEQGGQVSEETQGLSGAQEMFSVSERLSEVV